MPATPALVPSTTIRSATAPSTPVRSADVSTAKGPRHRDSHDKGTLPSLAEVRRLLDGLLRSEIGRRRLFIDDVTFDDLLQDLLILSWQRDLPRFDVDKGTLATFLRQRVRWQLMDHFRAIAKVATVSIDAFDDADDAGLFDTEAMCSPNPEETLNAHRRELTLWVLDEKVTKAIRQLKPRERTAVVEHDLRGKTLSDVAARLSVHRANASRARHRGLDRLRVELACDYRMAA